MNWGYELMLLYIYGIVQGVGFRPTVYRVAKSLELKGYVRNNGSNVEICIDKNYEEFLELLKKELPPLAKIEKVEAIESNCYKNFNDFKIIFSKNGTRESLIPSDTAICKECLNELFDKNNRRYYYPFINCTNCGARFSLIFDVPYDRKNTSMNDFRLCKICKKEYKNAENRRFHAQTISCKYDGPSYKLYDSNCKLINSKNPIKDFAEKIDQGKIGVIKGWGGMHIVCIPSEIERLRQWYKRPSKPFAVMVKDIKSIEKYAVIDSFSKELLESKQRPIVILLKKDSLDENLKNFLEIVSPGLDNIGIYLPYSGVQHILFNYLKNDLIVMTSANPKGEPILLENKETFSLNLDVYLLHNRKIINRIDDSVIIPYKNKKFFIRKSRGYVIEPIKVDYKENVVSFGAERNVTSSISKNFNLYTSQYIGNTNYYKTLEFLNYATKFLINLFGIKEIDAVGIDLHPQYPTRRVGIELVKNYNADLFEVQHHFAHAVSLMLDNNIEEPIIALTFDGAGYGTDGKIWGGEILYSDYNSFERLGSLEEIPLIGGDMAVKEPKRIVFWIYEKLGIDEVTSSYYNSKTSEILRKLIPKSPLSSSMGRVLDALSCFLKIATKRTYDGEPAIKLERYLNKGKAKFEFTTEILNKDRKIIKTLPLFEQLYNYSKKMELTEKNKADLAHSFVNCLIKNFVDIGCEFANKKGVKYIGFTGGVSYNLAITKMIEENILKNDMKLLLHNRIPNGDGGISIGQNVVVGKLTKKVKSNFVQF